MEKTDELKQKIELMTASLLSRSKQFKSQEQTGNEIMTFADNVVKLFDLPHIIQSASDDELSIEIESRGYVMNRDSDGHDD